MLIAKAMNIRSITTALCFAIFALAPSTAQAQINGFTEPLRKIELASDESGSISQMPVEEGDRVQTGDVLAHLDDRVQRLQVESARHLTQSTSSLDAARRTLEKRELISGRIRQLVSTGHATESEIIRADLEESIARARYVAAEEESIGRDIDLRRAELMLERRIIRAPFDGVVAKIHRREGEFLSPLHPELVTLIQVDKLLAVFNVPSSEVVGLRQKDRLSVSFADGVDRVGSLHSVNVQTDAESGTVQVKVLLDNAKGRLRSGEQCFLDIID